MRPRRSPAALRLARPVEVAAFDERVAAGRVERFAGERVGAPVARPHQILCIGLNYSDHAAETGQPTPVGKRCACHCANEEAS